jgi:hypothetical protein
VVDGHHDAKIETWRCISPSKIPPRAAVSGAAQARKGGVRLSVVRRCDGDPREGGRQERGRLEAEPRD